MISREIEEEFKIGKTQAANFVVNEARLRGGYENFNVETSKELKPSSTYSVPSTKNAKPQAFASRHQS